jgi:hypothetical protein
MSAKHTPGPWEAVIPSWGLPKIVDAGGREIAHHIANIERDGRTVNLNARLIAAAPDLARALADLLADAVEMGLDDSPVSGSLIEARKALRKAGVL